MKKLVCSALALSVTSAAGFASDSDWSTLDQSVEALNASLSVQDGGPQMFGRIRTLYANSGDIPAGVDADGDGELNDLGDFNVTDARFGVKGQRGDYSYKLQVDFADEPELLDAYVDFPIGGSVNGKFGQFKSGISRSALISSGKLVFVDRNVVGTLFSMRTEGIMVFGEFDQLGWSVGIQDGSDLEGDDVLITARVTFDVLGGGKDDSEGAYGGSDAPAATAGLAYFDDGAVDDADGFVAEFHGGTNVYSFGVDFVDIGDAISAGAGSTVDSLGLLLEADSTPWAVYGTYMLQPDTWEVAVRYQDLDNADNEDRIDLAVNNYLDGHNLKWTLQFSTASSDSALGDRDAIALQLQVAF